MSVSFRHVFAQGPALAALGRTAAGLLLKKKGGAAPVVPGAWIEARLPPRPPSLVSAYIRHTGGDPGWYRGRLPAHMFPQWGFAVAARTLLEVPYPLAKVMNAGCRVEQHAALPDGEELEVRARLESIDDDGKRAIMVQRVITGTKSAPDALVCDMRVFVPLAKADGPKKAAATVPAGEKEIAFLTLGADAGLDFAKLTGDFNPIHWLPAYARASGFKNVILHGFGTLARAVEALNRRVFAGDVSRLGTIDVRFTAPLVLPARVGVYVGPNGALHVGDAPGGRLFLDGRFTSTTRKDS